MGLPGSLFIQNFGKNPEHLEYKGKVLDTQEIGIIMVNIFSGRASNFTDDYPYSWSHVPYHPSTQNFKNAKVSVHLNIINLL